MKIELTEEHKFNNPYPWYRITIDGEFIVGSYDKDEIEKRYEEIKANPDVIQTKEKVLKSEEI
jgi:hypothetical protein